MTVVVPGMRNASILFGVLRRLLTIYTAAKSITGKSKLPAFRLSEFFETDLRDFSTNSVPTPKLKRTNFGVMNAFEKLGTIAIGRSSITTANITVSILFIVSSIFIYTYCFIFF